jgi:SAM-dependent methyltransferase
MHAKWQNGAHPMDEVHRVSQEAQEIWDRLAPWWDAKVGENANLTVWPTLERLLALRPDERVLEIACGNGAFARRMAELGAHVIACDFSAQFLRLAQERSNGRPDLAGHVAYRLIDATDARQLATLGQMGEFDAAVCVMGLMDMASIDPLLAALAKLLKPRGRFVFALTHPCFNTTGTKKVVEEEDQQGKLVTERSIKVSRYLRPWSTKGAGIDGQPAAHYYFERPLSVLFASCFRAGFALDGFEELAPPPPPDPSQLRPFSWAYFQEVPAFLVGRLRLIP